MDALKLSDAFKVNFNHQVSRALVSVSASPAWVVVKLPPIKRAERPAVHANLGVCVGESELVNPWVGSLFVPPLLH